MDSNELFFHSWLSLAWREFTNTNVVGVIVVFFLRGGMDPADRKVSFVNCVPESFCYCLKDERVEGNILEVFQNGCYFARGANVSMGKHTFGVTTWNCILFQDFCNIFIYPCLLVGVVWIEWWWRRLLYLFLILYLVLKFVFFCFFMYFLYLLSFRVKDFLHFNEWWIGFSQVEKRQVKFFGICEYISFLKMAF